MRLKFSVKFDLFSVDDILTAYLLAADIRYTGEIDKIKPPQSVKAVRKAISEILYRYGNDYWNRREEFPEDWEEHPNVVAVRNALIALL